MRFIKLKISDWRQFSAIDIDFHPRLTIITGANGAGKSTLLRILSQHFGWTASLLATPKKSKDGLVRYWTGKFESIFEKKEDVEPSSIVGIIDYSNSATTNLRLPTAGAIEFNLTIENMQSLPGLTINSHRPIPAYKKIENIPTDIICAEKAYNSYFTETVTRNSNGYSQYSPVYRMKEALISMATFGPGNQYVEANESVSQLFNSFKDILLKILPKSIGFRDISIRIPDVVIVTDTGDFVIDAASGGLMSLIDLAWQIFLFSHNKDEFTVVFDEPENHLHPSMQRSLIRKLLEAFPNAQFIIATHSPFIVSSVKDSVVYVLRYDDNPATQAPGLRRVLSLKLDNTNKAGTASEILRDVLGVPITLPEWAEDDLRKITDNFQIASLNTETINQLRTQLDEAGLGEYYPDALKCIADN